MFAFLEFSDVGDVATVVDFNASSSTRTGTSR